MKLLDLRKKRRNKRASAKLPLQRLIKERIKDKAKSLKSISINEQIDIVESSIRDVEIKRDTIDLFLTGNLVSSSSDGNKGAFNLYKNMDRKSLIEEKKFFQAKEMALRNKEKALREKELMALREQKIFYMKTTNGNRFYSIFR